MRYSQAAVLLFCMLCSFVVKDELAAEQPPVPRFTSVRRRPTSCSTLVLPGEERALVIDINASRSGHPSSVLTRGSSCKALNMTVA